MGDTSIYGACRAKETGRVFCFEFDVNNLVWLKRNLDLNPAIKPRIQVMPFALWDRSGESVIIDGEGPSARIMAGTEGRTVQSMAIDDLVTKGTTARIDFIKLDIEGAELRALKGAEMVLQQFRPRLAISVYHHEDDMWEIPLWINSLGLGYRFYLEHFTTHLEETVLFAIAEETADL
jgi:FkbM family methyltransferase